jgi:hypothetical protein
LFLLGDLYPLRNNDEGSLFKNFQIKEYSFAPVMCMYIFDEKDLIFGPYISRECDNIPLFHLKKRIYRKNISGAFNELELHYVTLSNPIMKNKICANDFCYFDRKEDKSIHALIERKYSGLFNHLTPQKEAEYEDYLIWKKNDSIPDEFIKGLAEEEKEGRFDAVMRHIVAEIEK